MFNLKFFNIWTKFYPHGFYFIIFACFFFNTKEIFSVSWFFENVEDNYFMFVCWEDVECQSEL